MPNMEFADPEIIYAMFKGEPGTRKSTAALSFPTPQYWFSYDQKMQGMIIPMRQWGIDPKLIDYDDYRGWNEARAKLEKFQTNCPYKTIVIDSMTSLADSILRQTITAKRGTTRGSGAQAGKQIAGIQVNELEDYNAETGALQELISLTKDINIHFKVNVILIAHVVQVDYKNTVTGQTHVSRQIVTAAKKTAAKIPGYCTEVYHFNIEGSIDTSQGGKYALLTQHTGDDFARTALPLPEKIVFQNDPLYSKYIRPAIDKLKNKLT